MLERKRRPGFLSLRELWIRGLIQTRVSESFESVCCSCQDRAVSAVSCWRYKTWRFDECLLLLMNALLYLQPNSNLRWNGMACAISIAGLEVDLAQFRVIGLMFSYPIKLPVTPVGLLGSALANSLMQMQAGVLLSLLKPLLLVPNFWSSFLKNASLPNWQLSHGMLKGTVERGSWRERRGEPIWLGSYELIVS